MPPRKLTKREQLWAKQSSWARKYGGHENWQYEQSGYTPIEKSVFSIHQPTNPDEAERKLLKENFQLDNLHQFTTRQLIDIDAISSRPLNSGNLRGPIAPFWERKNWFTGPLDILPQGVEPPLIYPIKPLPGIVGAFDEDTGRVRLIMTFLDADVVDPLLKSELTDAERLAYQYFVATTLAHECIHAFWLVVHMWENNGGTSLFEPYYEDEPLPELGMSWEKQTLGGFVAPMTYHWGGLPTFGFWYETEFPTIRDIEKRTKDGAVLLHPPLRNEVIRYPVEVSVFEDAHRSEFWDAVIIKFGTQILLSRPALHGSREVIAEGPDNQQQGRVQRLEELRVPGWGTTIRHEMAQRLSNASPEARVAIAFGDRLVKFSQMIQDFSAGTREFQRLMNLTIEYVARLGGQSLENMRTSDRYTLIAIVEHLKAAVKTHQNLINVLQGLELQGHGGDHPERRGNLLNFNRGLHRLTRDFRGHIGSADSSFGVVLNEILLDLENSRQRLLVPGRSTDPSFLEETNMLQAIRVENDMNNLTLMRSQLQELPDCSLFLLDSMYIYYARLDDTSTPERIFIQLQPAMERLRKMRSWGHRGWIPVLDPIIQAGNTVLGNVAAVLTDDELEKLEYPEDEDEIMYDI